MKANPADTALGAGNREPQPGPDSVLNGLDAAIERLGPVLVHSLFSAGRTLQIYDMNNNTVKQCLAKLMLTLMELFDAEGRVILSLKTDLLYINDVRIIVDSQAMGPLLYLIEKMKQRKVEEIDMIPGVTPEALGVFLKSFFEDPASDDVFGELNNRLESNAIASIRLTEWIERKKYLRDSKIERKEIREESNRVMSRAILYMGEVMRAVEQRRPIQIPKAHRLTQQIADIIETDETILVGLTSLKNYDEYTFSHSVNVSVLSMLIAERMGLGRSETASIGVAALLHDIGKTHIPQAILNKPAALTGDEWKFMERHPMLGVIELSRVRSLRAIADPLFTSLQHHLLYNCSGYPEKPGQWELHPYIHIVVVADIYDAMTTPRVYRKEPMTPDAVLQYILQNSGEMFDSLVAKVFIKAMGIYPIGTVVELNSGERAVVVRQNEQARFLHRPAVSLLGEDGPEEETIDLAAGDGGGFPRSIVRSIFDPACEAGKACRFIMK